MKQTLLKTLFFASILLVATSCNDDNDNNNNSGPTPISYSFTATETDPITSTSSDWIATSASARLNLDGTFDVTATNGADSVFFKFSGNQVGVFVVDTLSIYRTDNYFAASNNDDYGVTDSTGTVSFVITANDFENQQISGSFNAVFYNLDGSLDLVVLQDGLFVDLPYTIEEPELGGAGTISFTANGSATILDQIFSSTSMGTVQAVGTSLSSPTTSMTLTFSEDIAPGNYDLGNLFGAVTMAYTEGSQFFFSDAGTLTILANNTGTNEIQGTFSFSGSELLGSGTIEVTNGSFDIGY
jgi:hypothetical protein